MGHHSHLMGWDDSTFQLDSDFATFLFEESFSIEKSPNSFVFFFALLNELVGGPHKLSPRLLFVTCMHLVN